MEDHCKSRPSAAETSLTVCIQPLLDMDNTCLQLRMTEEEVKRLTEVLRGDAVSHPVSI